MNGLDQALENWSRTCRRADIYTNQLLDTQLFEREIGGTYLILIGTEFQVAPFSRFNSTGGLSVWRRGPKICSFEDVFENVSEDLQIKMLFHLDLLK